MAAKYAKKIDGVGSLDVDFKQVPLVQTFSNLHIVMEQLLKNNDEKQNLFFNLKKNPVTTEIL